MFLRTGRIDRTRVDTVEYASEASLTEVTRNKLGASEMKETCMRSNLRFSLFFKALAAGLLALALLFIPMIPAPTALAQSGPITLYADYTLASDMTFGGTGFIIAADNIILDLNGHTVTGSLAGNGIDVAGHTGVTIKNGTITGFVSGVCLSGSDNNIIKDIVATNSKFNGVSLFQDSDNNLVKGCTTMNNSSFGIIMNPWSDGNVIEDCTATSNEVGVVIGSPQPGTPSTSNTVKNNIVRNNHWGILVMNSGGNFLIGNTVTEHLMATDSYGIVVEYAADNNIVQENSITNNMNGILLRYGVNNIVQGNTVTDSQRHGIVLWNGANGNTALHNTVINSKLIGIVLGGANNNAVYENNFINNTTQAYVSSDSSDNIWNSSEALTYSYCGKTFTNYLGNYWSNYTGSDANGDGIGDTSYAINSDKDDYPLMKPFENYPTGPPDERIERAIAWALDWTDGAPYPSGGAERYRAVEYKIWCLAFVQDAYEYGAGVSITRYGSAKQAWKALSPLGGGIPPRGAYVFYDVLSGEYADLDHVGLSLGQGEIVHAHWTNGPEVAQYDKIGLKYIGWAWPPFGPKIVREGLNVMVTCPVDLSVSDPDGLVISKTSNQISEAAYLKDDLSGDGLPDDYVFIPELKTGKYLITLIPEPNAPQTATYRLEVWAIDTTIVLAENIQISNMPIEPYIVKATEIEVIQIMPATINFDPNTLNSKSNGKVVTAYIELPKGYDMKQIDISSIKLNSTVPALAKPTAIGDYDQDGIPDLMVKFDRNAVQAIVAVGDRVKITITGKVAGVDFEGSDVIRVIQK